MTAPPAPAVRHRHRPGAHASPARSAHLRQLRGRLATRDPGFGQLRRSVRAALGAGAALLLCGPLLAAAGQPSTVALLGAVVAMVSGVAVSDPQPRAQAATLALVPLPAAAGLVLGAVAQGHQVRTVVLFGVVIAVATYVRRWGPRYLALGFVGFMTFFFAQFLRATPAQVPWLLVAAVLGVATAAGLRVLLPDRPQRTVVRLLEAVQALAAEVVDGVAELVSRGPGIARRRRLVQALGDLNAAALLVEQELDRLDLPEDEVAPLRSGVLRLELALGHLVAAAVERGHDDGAALPALERTAEALRAADPHRLPAPPRGEDRLQEALRGVLRTVDALHGHAPVPAWSPGWATRDAPGPADDGPSPARLALQSTAQATVAGVGALLAGQLLSPTRWYWAVIAAFVIFTNVETRTATVRRALARGVGTLFGVVAGLAVGSQLQHAHGVAIALLFVFLVLGFWLQPTAYAASSACITVVLAMLYVLLGQLSVPLLGLRVEETALGAAVGAAAALLVMPARSGPVLGRRGALTLQRLADALRAVDDPAGLARAARDADTAFQDLRRAARPAAQGVPTPTARAVEQRVFALSGALRQLRALVASVLDLDGAPLPPAVRQGARALADRAEDLSRVLRGEPHGAPAHEPLDLLPGLSGPAREAALAVEGLAVRLDQLTAALPQDLLSPAAAPAPTGAPAG